VLHSLLRNERKVQTIMTENTTQEQQAAIWSQLQLENQKINPANKQNNDDYLNRNLQLGNLDRGTFEELRLKSDRALIFLNTSNPLYLNNGYRTLKKNEYVNVLSGSKAGFVRTSLNTQTQRQEMKDETKRGFSFGLFGKKK